MNAFRWQVLRLTITQQDLDHEDSGPCEYAENGAADDGGDITVHVIPLRYNWGQEKAPHLREQAGEWPTN